MTAGFALFLLIMGAAIGAGIQTAWDDYLEERRDLTSIRRSQTARRRLDRWED